ncbi:response regulator transcription factor [Saprospiraceae bacterium]|nr:response regulator transcription factor [bacterium]MDB4505798.1 response regulator transcription factor [Saprospiraceae bacterium]MDC3219820.1 response regulator transcription factor [Saprospiraceae bacterium]
MENILETATTTKTNDTMTPIKILIVDDETDILSFLKYNLLKEDYQVFSAENGLDCIKIAEKEIPNLIILDVMMPEMDGVEICHKLREIPELKNTLITFLSARGEEYSQIAGLEAGADDYIQKPIRPRLLISRVKALLRRLGNSENGTESPTNLQIGILSIDKERFEVFKSGEKIDLAKKEFDILWLLAQKPGKVFGREEIYRKVWGSNVIVGNRTIDVHISKLREKVGSEIIKTVKGIGYKIDQ